ncbi:MAG: hypothetical protein KGK34_08480 [Chloroflexota bacterium]|nr:hypothetical protein [Chloroflexota bacterium]
MAAQTSALEEAKALGLFQPQSAFEVHCGGCHTRLNGLGDCPSCGLIGRSAADVEARLGSDPAGTEKVLQAQIAKRRAYRPVKS